MYKELVDSDMICRTGISHLEIRVRLAYGILLAIDLVSSACEMFALKPQLSYTSTFWSHRSAFSKLAPD